MPNPSPSLSRFSDRETEEYLDAEDALFRPFGDAEGRLHWVVFVDPDGPACGSLNSTSNVQGVVLTACSRPQTLCRSLRQQTRPGPSGSPRRQTLSSKR